MDHPIMPLFVINNFTNNTRTRIDINNFEKIYFLPLITDIYGHNLFDKFHTFTKKKENFKSIKKREKQINKLKKEK